MSALPFAEWMAVTQDRAESALGRFLPGPDCIPARLHEAMRYATLGGGKRVRPLLAHALAEVAGEPADAGEVLDAVALLGPDLVDREIHPLGRQQALGQQRRAHSRRARS